MISTLENSVAPVVFTHSSCHALVENPRNVSDVILDKLKENNGIIMISLIPPFTCSDPTVADVDNVVDHILHAAKKIGFNHIGLGSDYDGMLKAVNGVEDVSQWPNLVATMLSRGIKRKDVEKVIGLNIIRVLKDVEEVAKKARVWPVLEDEVKQLWNENFRAFVRNEYPDAERDYIR